MLHKQFIDRAKQSGSTPALHDFTTERVLTRSEMLIATLILTRRFRRMSHGCIGVMIPVTAGCILTKIAILMSGRTPVMINYSTGAGHNARYAQRTCAFKTIITSRALLAKIQCPEIEGMVYIEDIFATLSKREKITAALIAALPASLIKKMVYGGDPDDTAVILFTSGSEKDPKAVQLSHRNIESNIASMISIFTFSPDDVFMCSLPYFHVYGLTVTFWLPLTYGMKMLTVADPLDFAKVCTVMRDHNATFLIGTPSFFWGYLRKSKENDFKTLRIAIVGADKCPDSLRNGWKEKHNVTLLEGYGATECSPVISTNTLEYNRPGSVGKPIPGIEIRIEHYKTGVECQAGEDGRILVRGNSVMKGYFNNFEQTSLHIRNGWYDTGDMGNIDADGYLWHIGRLKRFVKIGGEMISLVKIESVLENLLPEDADCCVVETPDPRKGAKIVAVVTTKIDEKATLKAMAKELPKIALPKIFLVWESLPKMGSGKIDFRKITEMTQEELH
ncbi:MAG: AMP-binding protein [Desulforhopalus sp.]|nr:AMP-binding protein [Desulforhopalus sp.]